MSSTIIFVGLPEDSKSSIIRNSSGSVAVWSRTNIEPNVLDYTQASSDVEPERSEVQPTRRKSADAFNEMMESRANTETNLIIDPILQPFSPSESLDESGCMQGTEEKEITDTLTIVTKLGDPSTKRSGSVIKDSDKSSSSWATVNLNMLKHTDDPFCAEPKYDGKRQGSEEKEITDTLTIVNKLGDPSTKRSGSVIKDLDKSSSSWATVNLNMLKHTDGPFCAEPKYDGKRRVPNAPKSSIAEIFNADQTDSPMKNGTSRPRVVRDTPTRPRDTHSRLFGQIRANNPVSPMVTDTIRSNIHFGDDVNGTSPSNSPSKLTNGSTASTPSRGEPALAGHCDGYAMPAQRRRHPAASMRGADLPPDDPYYQLLEPQPTHRYIMTECPPKPADYYVQSTTKPSVRVRQTPYTLLGLQTDDPEKPHPIIDPDSFSPQLISDNSWPPPFPAQHYLETKEHKIPYHPLPPHAFVGMRSALGERPKPDYKYKSIPSLDGPIDPFLVAQTEPPPTLFKYEHDGPIPDVMPLQTPKAPGPFTLTGFPPIFPKHVPGYLFNRNRHGDELKPKTYYLDYLRRREMEGNPITGDGYKSMNGQINTVTSVNGTSHMILHCRVPPGGYSSGLW